jgi:hypothetical protein
MELDELLLERLFEARQYIVTQAKNGAINEKKWADSWREDNIDPPPIGELLLPDDNGNTSFQEQINKAWKSAPSWFHFFVLYSQILENYKSEAYVEALKRSFFLEFQIGKEVGKLVERRRAAQASSNKKNQPARDAALNYYKRNSLDNLKAPAAASILEERAGVDRKYDALYDYVRFYRKRIKLINASIPKYRESLLSTLGADKDETGSIEKMVEEEV